jgi:hypothetical protein
MLKAGITALVSLVVLLGSLGAALASAAAMPMEGIFEDCSLDTAMALCAQRLSVMHAGGLQVVLVPAWGASLPSLTSYAAAARALGMSVIWELSNPGWWEEAPTSTDMAGYFPSFAAPCGCSQNGALLSYLTRWLGALPGTYGYYAADDSMLSPGDRDGMSAYVAAIKRNDPRHTVLISSFSQSQAQAYEGIADLTAQELYPIKTRSLLPVSTNQPAWASVARTASRTQAAANRAHKQSAFILQAFTWGDNIDDGVSTGTCWAAESKQSCYSSLRYPSGLEQLRLRNEILLHARPALILWWSFQGTYGEADGDTYSIYPTGNEAAARWAGLSAAIRAPMPRVLTPRPDRDYQSSRRTKSSSVNRVHRAPPRVRPACSARRPSTATPLRCRRM